MEITKETTVADLAKFFADPRRSPTHLLYAVRLAYKLRWPDAAHKYLARDLEEEIFVYGPLIWED